MRPLIQTLHRARRTLLRLLRWPTRGVKVMVFDAQGALLLVRHSYGDTESFLLPGGGIHRREQPIDAAAREVREEVSLALTGLILGSTHHSRVEGKRDTVYLFTARADSKPKPDGAEVVEARFFPLDALPSAASPATLRRIAEYRGERPIDPAW